MVVGLQVLSHVKKIGKEFDEDVFNLGLLTFSSIVLCYMNTKVDCVKKTTNFSSDFLGHFIYLTSNFGIDQQCVEVRAYLQFFCILMSMLSLIFEINILDLRLFGEENQHDITRLFTKKLLISFVITNYSSRLWVALFQTSIGSILSSLTVNLLFNYSSYLSPLIQLFSKYTMLFDKVRYSLSTFFFQ